MAATSGDVVHLLRDCPQSEQRFQPLHLPFRKAPASSRRPSRLIRAPSSEPRRRLRRPFLARRAGSVRAETAPHPSFGITVTLAPVHDDATIDEAVAALARELGGYLIAADAGLGSVPLEVRVTRRWRELDSKFQFLATVGGFAGLRDTRSGQSSGSHRSSFRSTAVRTWIRLPVDRLRFQGFVACLQRSPP